MRRFLSTTCTFIVILCLGFVQWGVWIYLSVTRKSQYPEPENLNLKPTPLHLSLPRTWKPKPDPNLKPWSPICPTPLHLSLPRTYKPKPDPNLKPWRQICPTPLHLEPGTRKPKPKSKHQTLESNLSWKPKSNRMFYVDEDDNAF